MARRDLLSKLETREMKSKEKRKNNFPCDSKHDDRDEFVRRDQKRDSANRRELAHVRAPVPCPKSKLELLVDRTTGERPGLVNGDYVIVELASEGLNKRVYANVVLRGLKGMHLLELNTLRERRSTWKFCFYQAIVALLAKTQLRYKYAWSANIDYIYELAWTLYTHIGAINVKEKQRLDDIVVYNYKYSIEIELMQKMRKIPVMQDADFMYEESALRGQIMLRRKDPLKVRIELGCRKMTDPGYVSVHEDTRKIEEWFDKLETQYRDCIFRTTRFSLAFWREGVFWYVYNPYRCDEFGLWDSGGSACIVKFCSKDSLRRHLMILLLRAYGYQVPRSQDRSQISEENVFDIEIFYVTLRCCRLHDLKLLERVPPESPRHMDECSLDLLGDPGDEIDREEVKREDDSKGPKREKLAWLKSHRVTWSRCAAINRRKRGSIKLAVRDSKARWHQYYVEEADRLFSLWGEMHVTDSIFDETNRGMQTYACYVVCAGMTRIIAPEYWSSRILDVIVMCGDRYYTRSKLEAELKSAKREYAHVACWDKYLSDRFKIGETLFEARMLPAICGRLYGRSNECLWRLLERTFTDHHFGILACESACLGLFTFCGTYYMCDVNSYGPPFFRYGHGTVYLLRATSFRKFVTVLVLTIGSYESSRFTLNPVEILRILEVDPAFDSRARTTERRKIAPGDSPENRARSTGRRRQR
ncbi:hypothetical protein X777_05861 [Ooceraea biroi]|uniref:Uncharacterized protein n=1 Tax=Ooceraea biroi TaxID=2015173 RepID=A0A026WD71_OOCBI|nr:hypothetical protein X777_05861 [Ooceraea biroi]